MRGFRVFLRKPAMMEVGFRIRRPANDSEVASGLTDLLIDVVADGFAVGFLAPLTRERALAFWRDSLERAERGERILLIAEHADTGQILGTVQLLLALPENQPHRANLVKMQVHRSARGKGVGAALLRAAEAAALEAGRTLLLLDTATGSTAEGFYARFGWNRVGVIPDYARYPDGRPCSTTVFYKRLSPSQGDEPFGTGDQ